MAIKHQYVKSRSFRSYLKKGFFVILILIEHLERSSRCDGLGTSYFETHPRDVIIQEGGSAAYICTVLEFDPNTETLTWHVFPNEYPTEISEYYDASSQNQTSMIIVNNVGRNEQSFKCVLRGLYDDDGVLDLRTHYSRVAYMHVQYFPRDDEISCSPQHLGERRTGYLLNIQCTVQKGNPLVHLSWKIPKSNVSSSRSNLVTKGQKLILDLDIYLSPHLHSQTISCAASSDSSIFLDQEISCSIGPLLVRYKPEVVIQPNKDSDAGPTDSANIELICAASSYPDNKSYRWSCFPPDIINDCNNAIGETLSLRTNLSSISRRIRSMAIRCSVTNSEGTNTAEYNLPLKEEEGIDINIESINDDTFPNDTALCQNASLNLNILNGSVNWENFLFEANFVCFRDCLTQTDGSNTSLAWFVSISESHHDQIYIRYTASSTRSYLTVNGTFDENDVLNVSCGTSNNLFRENMNVVLTMSNNHFQVYKSSFHGAFNKSGTEDAEQETNIKNIIHLAELVTTSLNTEKHNSGVDPPIWSELVGIRAIIFIAVAVLGGIILTACLCACCTVFLFKYLQGSSTGEYRKSSDQHISTKCVKCDNCRTECSHQSGESMTNADFSYEEPIAMPPPPPPLPPPMTDRKEYVDDDYASSFGSSGCYHLSGSLTSDKSSNYCSDISTSSQVSDRDGYMHPHSHEDSGSVASIFSLQDHEYSNAGVITMHMFSQSVSVGRMHLHKDLSES